MMKRVLCSWVCGLGIAVIAAPAYAQYGIFDSIADWEGRGNIKVEGDVQVEGEGDDAEYHLWGNGDDIWDNQDEGLFLYTELEGNWSLEARVQWVEPGTNDWAKIGVMVRENPQDPESRHYWIEMRGAGMGDRVDAQWRTSTGGSSGNAQIFFPPQTPLAGDPVDAIGGATWLRVTRIADLNLFYTEISDDGFEWIMVHNQIQEWPSATAGFGLAITDHTDTEQLAHAIATNVRITEPARVKPFDGPVFDYHMDVYNSFSDRLITEGGAEYDAATDSYTVWGSGWDIWDDSDNGHFLFTQVSGDFEFIATGAFDVDRSDPPHDDWYKLMLWARQDLTGGAVNYGSRIRAGNTPTLDEGQYSWQKRQEANGGSASVGDGRVMLGAELGLEEWTMRILREGDQFSLYYLEDFGPQAGEWIEVQDFSRADQVVPMNDPIFVGFGVTSHQNGGVGGEVVYGVFSNVQLNVEGEVSVHDWSLY